jgi:hypothetical protein
VSNIKGDIASLESCKNFCIYTLTLHKFVVAFDTFQTLLSFVFTNGEALINAHSFPLTSLFVNFSDAGNHGNASVILHPANTEGFH